MSHLTTGQIGQLIEIDKAGEGIHDELQELIRRLTSGGVGIKTEDPRVAQAKRLYDKGFGGKLPFVKYLASIPPVPNFPEIYTGRFPLLVLVDARMSITKQCKLLGVDVSGNDQTYVDFDPKTVRVEKVYWIRVQDGRKNDSLTVLYCRKYIDIDEVGLSIFEGLALFAQNPEDLRGRAIDLPGSVLRGDRTRAAFLGWHGARPSLYDRSGGMQPYCGSATRGK